MNEFLDERIRLVRQLIGRADPFTKTRLEKLAERYEAERGSSSRAGTNQVADIAFGPARLRLTDDRCSLRVDGHDSLGCPTRVRVRDITGVEFKFSRFQPGKATGA